jgi:hypothetical protein
MLTNFVKAALPILYVWTNKHVYIDPFVPEYLFFLKRLFSYCSLLSLLMLELLNRLFRVHNLHHIVTKNVSSEPRGQIYMVFRLIKGPRMSNIMLSGDTYTWQQMEEQKSHIFT